MNRGKLYAIRKHYTIVKNVPQGPTVTVKPTAYLLRLTPDVAIAEITCYIEWLEGSLRQDPEASTSEDSEKVRKAQFELEIAQQFLADLKHRYEAEN